MTLANYTNKINRILADKKEEFYSEKDVFNLWLSFRTELRSRVVHKKLFKHR